MATGPTSRGHRLALAAALVFPIALLAISTFYFFGAIGRFNDDYFYLQRDLSTWQIRSLILDRPFHVWRPLFQVVVPALQTLLWDHNWALHLISTLLHGVNTWLIFRLLVRFGLSTRISAAAAMIFLVYPGHFEAVFWSSCVPTLMATGLLLGCMHAHLSWLEMPADQPRGVRKLYPLGLAITAFCIAALNEQPAGPLATLPLLVFLRPPAPGVPLARHIRRAAFPAACAGIALIIYVVGHYHNMADRGWIAAKAPLRVRLPANVLTVAERVPTELLLRDFAAGAWSHGRSVLLANPTLSLAFAALLIIGLVLGARAWLRGDTVPQETQRPAASDAPMSARRIAALVLFALAWIVCAWIPIVVNHAVTTPRLHYVADIGLLILCALAAHLTARSLARIMPLNALRVVGGAALVAATLAMSVMMVGIQDGYRLRAERDLSEARQLADLFKDVPSGTLFVPMRVESRVLNTSSWKFDLYFLSCWNWHYAAGWNLQQVFRRDDIHTVQAGFQEWMGVWAPTDGTDVRSTAVLVGVVARPFPVPNFTRNPEGAGRLVAWNRIVPFTVERNGRVQVYTRVYYTPDDKSRAFDFTPDLVEQAIKRHALPRKNMTLRPFPEELRKKPRDKNAEDDADGGISDPGPRRRRQPPGIAQPQ